MSPLDTNIGNDKYKRQLSGAIEHFFINSSELTCKAKTSVMKVYKCGKTVIKAFANSACPYAFYKRVTFRTPAVFYEIG